MDSFERSFRHAVLISEEAKFHEAAEKGLRECWPGVQVARVHPGGDLSGLRAVMAADPRPAILIDRRKALRPEFWKSLRKYVFEGARALALADVPHSAKDLVASPIEGIGLFLHNKGWHSPATARAAAMVLEGRGLSEESGCISPLVQGRAILLNSGEKSEFLENLGNELEKAGIQRTKRGKIAAVADELAMNALYDAPRVSTGRKDGSTAVIDIRWKLSSSEVWLTVSDPYGALPLEVISRRLVTFATQKTVEITRTATKGGGVGLYTVFRNASSYRLYVVPGKLTEVSVSIDLSAGAASARATASKRNREIFICFSAHAEF